MSKTAQHPESSWDQMCRFVSKASPHILLFFVALPYLMLIEAVRYHLVGEFILLIGLAVPFIAPIAAFEYFKPRNIFLKIFLLTTLFASGCFLSVWVPIRLVRNSVIHDANSKIEKRDQLVHFVLTNPLEFEEDRWSYELPKQFQGLSYKNEFSLRRSPDRTVIALPIMLSGLDNATALIYTTDGKPPHKEDYFEIVSSKPLRPNWFLVETT